MKIQIRLSEKNIQRIKDIVIPQYHKQYPIVKRHSELTKPTSIDDGVAFLIDFWEKNW